TAQPAWRRRAAPATPAGTPAVPSELPGPRTVSDTSALCSADGIADGRAGVLAGCGGGVPPATSACETHPPPTRRWYPAPETKSHNRRSPTFLNQLGGNEIGRAHV